MKIYSFCRSNKGIFIISLILLNFFGIVAIPNAFLLIGLLPFIIIEIGRKQPFQTSYILMIIGLFLSMVSCYIYRGQDFISSFKAMPVVFYIFFFYLLLYLKPKIIQIENVLQWLIIIFDILYICQFVLLQSGIVFLPMDETTSDQGEEARFRMVASGLASLGVFYGCNKLLIKKRLLPFVIVILSFIVILLMAFRTMIFFTVIFSVILLFKVNRGFNKKTFLYIIGGTLLLVFLFNMPVLSDKLNYMLDKQFGQDSQTLDNKDYIRNVTLNYYLFHHFKSPLEFVLGSGLPFSEHAYYNEFKSLAFSGIFFMDWGLLGLSWMIGILPVCCMIYYSFKSFVLKVDSRFYYMGIWFVYLVVSSITTAEFYRNGNYVIQALCLYLVYSANQQFKYEHSK